MELKTKLFFGFFFIIFSFFSCKKLETKTEDFYSNFSDSIILDLDPKFNQFVHPDIIYVNSEKTFYLACTPYPYGSDKFENPHIYLSYNSITFFGNNNPIVTSPTIGHNDDPDIFYDNLTKKFYLSYLETCLPDSQNFILLQKSNITSKWNRKISIHFNIKAKDNFIVSPSIIDGLENNYLLFFVNVLNPCIIQYIESNSILSWDFQNKKVLNIPFPKDYYPWHIDIIKHNSYYYLICSTIYNLKNSLFISRSNDLLNWETKEILSPADLVNMRCKFIYRSTGVFMDNVLLLYYSFCNTAGVWKIARKSIPDSKIFN
jgi:hypothetical protein